MGNQISSSVANNNTDQSQSVKAGGNVTYATYNVYGDTYAQSSTAAKFDQDPKPFTDSAVDMSKVALASPTVEECGYSDRLMQMTLGNSTITTQESAHVICAYKRWPTRLSPSEATAIDMPTYPDVAVNRFYTLASEDWTKTSKGWFWRFPGCLKDVGLFGQNMAYHFLQRSGFAVHVQCNASRFHQGMLLVVWIPEFEFLSSNISGADDSGIFDDEAIEAMREWYPWQQLTLFPHQFVNLRTNNCATIIVPYINSVPMDNGLTHNNGALLILPIVDLDYSTGASPAVGVTLTVAPMEAEYNGLRFAITQGIRVRNLPGSGQFLTTENASAPPIFPRFDESQVIDIPGEVENLLDVAKIPTFFSPKIYDRKALSLSTSNEAGSTVYFGQLQLDHLTEGSTQPIRQSYLGLLARFYSQWSGSIRISFVFTGSAMTTGKLLLCYTPPGGRRPETRAEGMLGTHIIWDFGLQSSVDMVIPWISATQYRIADSQRQSSDLFCSSGWLTIFMQTRMIVPPDVPTTAYIVGFVSACDDFALRLPMDYVQLQGPVKVSKNGVSAGAVAAGPSGTTTSPQSATSGELVTTEAPALNAVESGSGDDTQPAQVMETRAVTCVKGVFETSVENFLARSSLAAVLTFTHQLESDGSIGTAKGYTTWPVSVLSDSNWDLKRKLRMFTYARFSLEMTVLITTSGQQEYENLRFQTMYCPPGSRLPNSQDSTRWQSATSPSIFTSMSDPPATVSVPFLSAGGAYNMFYDGYSDFSSSSAVYGEYPLNEIGALAVRVINRPNNVPVNVEVRIYIKPKHVRVWIPRPISNSMTTAGGPHSWFGDKQGFVAGNKYYVNYHLVPPHMLKHATKIDKFHDLCIFEVKEQDARPEVQIPRCTCCKGWYYSNLTRRIQHAYISPPRMQHFEASQWYPHHFQEVHLAEGPGQEGDCGNVLYCRHGPIGMVTGAARGIVAFIPLRIWAGAFLREHMAVIKYALDNDICTVDGTDVWKGMKGEWKVFRNLDERSFKTHGKTRGIAIGAVQLIPAHTHQGERVLAHHGSREVLVVEGRPGCHALTPAVCDCHSGIYYSHKTTRIHHVQLSPPGLYKFRTPEGERYRSSVMVGCGPAQPGDCGQPIFCGHGVFGMLIGGDEALGTVAFADVRDLMARYVAREQGLTDWISALGQSFGVGFVTEVKSAISGMGDAIMGILPSWMTVLELVIQVVAALGICIKHPEPGTVLAVLALLGCSHTAPFTWLKQRVCGMLGVRWVPKQGDSWLKKFTESVNAFKGLEWVVQKLGKFVEWMKTKILPECKEKQEFLERLQKLPALKAQIDQLAVKGSHAAADKVQRLYTNIMYYKKYCDKYAPLYAAESKMVRECERILNQRQIFSRETRPEPVAIVIRGTPGCGKSLASTLIGRALAKHAKSDVYSLPPDPKHFDGYEGQRVCLMDDVGQNPDGEDLKYFCQMVSTTQFHPPMADLADKGITFDAEYVICTTNLETFNPPTISEPLALARRFYLDLKMCVKEGFSISGRLNGSKACRKCDHCDPKNFTCCNPLICGKAVSLKHGNCLFTIDEIVSAMIRENNNRKQVTDMLAAVLQGSDWFDDCECEISLDKPAPECIQDLLSATRSEEVREYCKSKGWIVEERVSKERIVRETMLASSIIQSCAAVIALCSAIYVCFKLYYTIQGPYTGMPQPKKQVPTLREVTIQGPNLDFAVSLLGRNMAILQSEYGEYSCLGICDKLLAIPSHAFGTSMRLNGLPLQYEDAWSIRGEQAKCEITVLKLKRNEKFRDIRAYIPDDIGEWSDCCVVLNTTQYPRMFLPVGNVTPTQNILLSGVETQNILYYNYPTKSGQCGGVVCKTGKVIGMHIGGNGAQGFAAALLKKYFTTEQGQVEVVEKSKVRLHMPAKTVLQPSVFHNVFPGEKEPAVLHPGDKRLEVEFREALFSKYSGNVDVKYERDEFMKRAVDHYAAQLKTLDIEGGDLTTEEALFGYEGLDALDLQTSAGYPFVTLGIKKKDFIKSTDKEGSARRMEQMIDKYGLELPFVTYVKDELRSKEKVRKGKSRLIEASSLNDSVAMRRCFGKLYSTFHQNPGTVTGSAVGCDPDVFWSKVPCMMEEHLLCFDYTAFDASLSPCWFEALKDLLSQIGFERGKGFIDYMCHSVHLMGADRYVVNGGMPSGCSGTSIFNSMINNIIMRTLILRTYKGIDLDEFKMIAYGDDVIASYTFPLDAAKIAETGKTYGLTITPADKGKEFAKVDWGNVTFLKRYFRADEKYPFLVHPVMPMKEIHESIRWTKDPTKTQEHVRSLCELAWHNGEDVYNKFCDTIRTVPVGTKLYLPAYSTLYQKWVEKF
ncbi:polyprotein [enterovirus K2]|uniref:Genome polyprotein n=1 Tax=enterovirus K2 TaxID=2849475 RepID=A0A1I9WAM4_9ENTO|nr:polyprotein [enterovirus K2]